MAKKVKAAFMRPLKVSEELAAVISEYARTGFSSFLAKRNEVFPEPFEQGKCIRLMADALEKLI